MTKFAATFFDGINAKAHSVVLTAEDALNVSLEGDGIVRSYPLSNIRVTTAVGSIPRFVYFPDGGRCEAWENGPLDQLQAATGKSAAPSSLKKLEKHAVAVAAVTFLLIAAAIFVFQWALPLLIRRVAQAVPVSVERRLSDGALTALDARMFRPSSLNSWRQRELSKKFEGFVHTSGYSGHTQLIFRQMADGSANAFALPNGSIVLTDRLVEISHDDNELLAVLGHEVGHLYHRHTLRLLLQNSVTLVLVTSLTGDASTVANLAGTLPLVLLSTKFSREFELEADLFSLDALRKANIPPRSFLQIMQALENDRTMLHSKQRPSIYLSTHPATAERMQRFEKAAAETAISK